MVQVNNQNEKASREAGPISWGGRWGSNPQPPDPQSGAPPLSYAHHSENGFYHEGIWIASPRPEVLFDQLPDNFHNPGLRNQALFTGLQVFHGGEVLSLFVRTNHDGEAHPHPITVFELFG
jgi:hypothetical protein